MPHLPDAVRKSELVAYRLTQQERADLERLAASRQQSLSDLLRDSLRAFMATNPMQEVKPT